MSGQIAPGTTFRLPCESPDVLWRVVWGVGRIAYGDDAWNVYRCEQVSGDRSLYPMDRRDDGMVDFAGDAIEDAVRAMA